MNDASLLQILKARFDKHLERHAAIGWSEVQVRLERAPEALAALRAMEETGGEPDVVGRADDAGQILFCDCCAESLILPSSSGHPVKRYTARGEPWQDPQAR